MQLLPGQLECFKTLNVFVHVMELQCGMKLVNSHRTNYEEFDYSTVDVKCEL